MSQLGECDRRQQAELMHLRKEHQEMSEAVHRSKTDVADLRQRLAAQESEAGRQQQHAAAAAAEGGGAVTQLRGGCVQRVCVFDVILLVLMFMFIICRPYAQLLRLELVGGTHQWDCL
jgi:hypothetical protein